VHEKLQNFMVPVSFVRGGWHEEQIDELFASLLGKGVEGGPERKDETRMVLEEKIVADAVKAGFRIFG
jgi:protein AATF/BFR2